MDLTTIERRLRQLEDAEAIRTLKHRYFVCCDRKDPKGMRSCFVDGPVAIDYGAVGKFKDADAVVKLFTEIGCQPHMVEMHHGANPQIEVIDATRARGTWSLQYFLINTRDQTLTRLSGQYEDEYRKTEGGWKMSATTFTATSTLAMSYADGAVKTMFAGSAPPA